MEQDKADRLRERLAAASSFAQTLTGLTADAATARAAAAGFHAEVLQPSHSPVTADLRSDRIRLHTDARDRVVRASAG